MIQTAIEEFEVGSATETNYSQYRIEVENVQFESVAKADQIININRMKLGVQDDAGNMSNRNSDNKESVNSASSIIKLAALNIAVFKGNYTEQVTFHDIYTALIHTNSSLTSIQKFFYLRTSLDGDVANSIKNL